MASYPLIVAPGDGHKLSNPVGGEVTFKVRGLESDGVITTFESVIAPGDGPPLHTHANEVEILYVLEGSFRFQLGDDVVDAPAGATMFVPPGIAHYFQNAGERPGTLLIVFSPSGMERFFELTGADRSAFAEMAANVGMEVVGPPLGTR
jgi:quercetin dioxygenase-like cupin family protein